MAQSNRVYSTSNQLDGVYVTSEDSPQERVRDMINDWKQANKILERDGKGQDAVPKNPLDPPRPARNGHEWVWFTEGYWAERPVVNHAINSNTCNIQKSRERKLIFEKRRSASFVQCRDDLNSPDRQNPTIKSSPASIFNLRRGVEEVVTPGASIRSAMKTITKGLQQTSPKWVRAIPQEGESETLMSRTKRNIKMRLGSQQKKVGNIWGICIEWG